MGHTMGSKPQTQYECSNCGHIERKWLGRCPSCGEWNTLVESAAPAARGGNRTPPGSGRRRAAGSQSAPRTTTLARPPAASEEEVRHSTGMAELDRVLGGGLVPGASILVGGEPGIGKSTLMLQMAAQVRQRRVLYVTGEESVRQIRLRAERLGISNSDLEVVSESRLEQILTLLGPAGARTPDVATRRSGPRYDVVIVDSIQTLHSPEAGSVPGSPNQIKYGAFELSDWARTSDATLFLVAHVTKEGSIAGPKMIEHMVDTVLYFEQSEDDTRFLRATKNRFGSTEEIGLFLMQTDGLAQVTDPNSIFLVRRDGSTPSGVAVAPVVEGSRILLVEVQALTVPAKGGISRVFSDRLDSRRVSRMAAVLEKHLDIEFSDQDIYVNVAGGMRIADVGVELPLAMALYSARADKPLPKGTAVAGEVSLAGEVRPVAQMARRARAGQELGMSRCIGPARTRDGEAEGSVKWTPVTSVGNAVRVLFG